MVAPSPAVSFPGPKRVAHTFRASGSYDWQGQRRGRPMDLIYLTRSPSGPVGCANSFIEALGLAHKLSEHTQSPLLVPSEIECLNTGERFNATAIESWWRKLGWPQPQ
jgi:hypothetical protein